MYSLLLWFKSARLEIARNELEPHRQASLALALTQREKRVINQCYDDAIPKVADKLHPLRLLRILK